MTILDTVESLSFQNHKKHPYEAFDNIKNGISWDSKFEKKLISHKPEKKIENFLSPKFIMWNQFAEYLLSTKTDLMESILVKTQVLAIFDS